MEMLLGCALFSDMENQSFLIW